MKKFKTKKSPQKISPSTKLDKILVILQRLEKKISGGTKNVKNKSNR